jgi:hypothetical protein
MGKHFAEMGKAAKEMGKFPIFLIRDSSCAVSLTPGLTLRESTNIPRRVKPVPGIGATKKPQLGAGAFLQGFKHIEQGVGPCDAFHSH